MALAFFEALCSGEVEPRVGFDMILRDAVAVGVHESECELGTCVALRGGGAVPPDSVGAVPGYAGHRSGSMACGSPSGPRTPLGPFRATSWTPESSCSPSHTRSGKPDRRACSFRDSAALKPGLVEIPSGPASEAPLYLLVGRGRRAQRIPPRRGGLVPTAFVTSDRLPACWLDGHPMDPCVPAFPTRRGCKARLLPGSVARCHVGALFQSARFAVTDLPAYFGNRSTGLNDAEGLRVGSLNLNALDVPCIG